VKDARDLLFALLMAAVPMVAARSLRGPPALGPPEPVARCDVPVEVAGAGVACVERVRARGARVRAGDRLRWVAAEPGRGRVRRERMAPERLAEWEAPVDVNRASAEELASLDGIGARLAERIVRARPFPTVEAVARVPGVGRAKWARLRPRLSLGLDE
jgi:competence ComEA-like helix-hairpin-helix protein